jgi:branched-chain amino acid aminotransferase
MDISIRTPGTDRVLARTMLGKQPLGFGKYFADLMFRMRYSEALGWHDAEIGPYQPIVLDPATMVLHYGQEIFEGLKAYRWPDGHLAMFRPEANAARLNRSAARLCMPAVPVEDQLTATFELVSMLEAWAPEPPAALYVRPTMIATEAALGVHVSNEYLYFIICSPVGPYFPKGFAPVRVKAEPGYVRAAEGGTGDAKCGGNYAGSLLGQSAAKKEGYDQVVWLDAKEHRYVEEIGAMNIFFVVGGTLVTSPLGGSILPGITRDSILRLAASLGIPVEERRISIDEVTRGIRQGTLTESFGAGTAAIVTPIGTVGWMGEDYVVNGGAVGPITRQIYETLTGYQFGRAVDPFGWMRPVSAAVAR